MPPSGRRRGWSGGQRAPCAGAARRERGERGLPHRHYDFYLAGDESSMIALQEQKVLGTRWLLVPEVISPTLRAKHLAAALDGRPEPVNTCALMRDGAGRYLLHLHDHKPGAIFESGAFAPSLAAVVRTTTRAWRTRC